MIGRQKSFREEHPLGKHPSHRDATVTARLGHSECLRAALLLCKPNCAVWRDDGASPAALADSDVTRPTPSRVCVQRNGKLKPRASETSTQIASRCACVS